MSINVIVKHGNNVAKVNDHGEFVTGSVEDSTPTAVTVVDVINTAFNLQVPISGFFFRLTEIIISTDKSVSVNGAVVEIYEADAEDTLTSTKDLPIINMNRQDRFAITGLNWRITEGKWLNIKSDEVDVDVTVAGYYVKLTN